MLNHRRMVTGALNTAMVWRKCLNEARKGSREYEKYKVALRRQARIIAIANRLKAIGEIQ